jgi:hypothetical protein
MRHHPTRARTAAILLSTLALVLIAGAASAAEVERSKYNDKSVNATFDSTDASGCIRTWLSLWGFNAVVRSTQGSRTPEARGYLSVYRIDVCRGNALLLSASGSFPLEPGELTFKANLASATLTTTFLVFDYVSHTDKTVVVDLAWTATGPVWHGQDRVSFHTPGISFTNRQQGSGRSASASGSVLYDGSEMMSGPSDDGMIAVARVGAISIETFD